MEVATEVMKEVAERVVAVEARVAGSAEVVRAAAKVEVAREVERAAGATVVGLGVEVRVEVRTCSRACVCVGSPLTQPEGSAREQCGGGDNVWRW